MAERLFEFLRQFVDAYGYWTLVVVLLLENVGVPAPGETTLLFVSFLAWSERELHLGYIILKGFPVRHYRADITLTPDGSGTVIGWRASFDTLLPGSGHPMVAVLRTVIGRFARGVARYAETLADTPS